MSYQHKILRRVHPQSLSHQKGVVIIIALFIVALVTAMAYAMMARLGRDTQRISLITHDVQAYNYAQGSIAWAMDQLRNDWENQKPNQMVDPIPIHSTPLMVNGYKISSTIYDMQSRFNLNNVITPEATVDFKQLLLGVQPDLPDAKAQDIAKAVFDWIKPGQGENDKFYLQQKTPYRAAHRLMQSASELQLVRGMTPALYNALKPWVVALPMQTQINVQTAPAVVLKSLSSSMTLVTAQTIEHLRQQTPLISVQQFLALDVIKNHAVQASKVTDKSAFFLVETNIEIEQQHIVLYTLLERSGTQNKAALTILWQSKGVW